MRLRSGDESARDRLAQRYLQTLRHWAHGRLPARARGLCDTDDLVQSTLIRALNRLGTFESRLSALLGPASGRTYRHEDIWIWHSHFVHAARP